MWDRQCLTLLQDRTNHKTEEILGCREVLLWLRVLIIFLLDPRLLGHIYKQHHNSTRTEHPRSIGRLQQLYTHTKCATGQSCSFKPLTCKAFARSRMRSANEPELKFNRVLNARKPCKRCDTFMPRRSSRCYTLGSGGEASVTGLAKQNNSNIFLPGCRSVSLPSLCPPGPPKPKQLG